MTILNKKICDMASLMFYGNTSSGHWIYEKLQKSSSYFHMMINLLFFAAKVPRVHKQLTVVIEPVFGCNIDCTYCWKNMEVPAGLGPIKNRPHYIPWEIFKKTIDELPSSVETVVFAGLGEPLLHPDFFEMIEYASSSGFRVIVYSNGTLLKEEILVRLAASSISVVNISVEPDSETFLKYRGINMEEFTENIRAFKNKKRPGIELKFALVIHPGNYDKMIHLDQNWKQYSDCFKIVKKGDYDKKVGFLNCFEPWIGRSIVYSNGDIGICCALGWPIIIGNITKKSFEEIINGKTHQKVLKSLISGNDIPNVCKYCSQFETNQPTFSFLKNLHIRHKGS